MVENGFKEDSRCALIVGCGYVGRVLARELTNDGVTVFGTVRTEQSVGAVQRTNAQPLLCDVTDPKSLDALGPALKYQSLEVYYLVPPGRSKDQTEAVRTVIRGAKSVLERLRDSDVRRVVMVSSTGVYGHTNGEVVNADTPADPKTGRAEMLLQGEDVWLNSDIDCNEDCKVVRLAGLYGPNRVVGLQAVQQNSALVGQGDAWLNLIHVDDAVALLQAVMHSDSAAAVELGSDGTPVQRLEYYNALAKRVGSPPIRMIEDEAELKSMGLDAIRIRSSGLGKQCDPSATMKRTGWSPLYSDYKTGFDTLAEVVLRVGL